MVVSFRWVCDNYSFLIVWRSGILDKALRLLEDFRFVEIGSKVQYQSKVYTIKWIFESGYCEIEKDRTILLVK